MKLVDRRVTTVLCSIAVVAMTGAAYAKPVKKVAHRQVQEVGVTTANFEERNELYAHYGPVMKGRTRTAVAPAAKQRRARATAQQPAASIAGGFGTSALVAEARKYLGTNPTGRASLWCGAFMDLVLKRTGHAGGGNLASAYARYGTRVSGPQVGAIAVMGRKGGGHVGVVSGVDANGNPIIISGNHNRTTAESVYPRSRIVAYVVPN